VQRLLAIRKNRGGRAPEPGLQRGLRRQESDGDFMGFSNAGSGKAPIAADEAEPRSRGEDIPQRSKVEG